jgi:hypothetical protein
MVPAKPFWLTTAIVVLHVAPVLQLTVTGELGVMVKSVTLRLKLFWLKLWVESPLYVPVIAWVPVPKTVGV